jgi:uncharacterized protein (UPF0212 family)
MNYRDLAILIPDNVRSQRIICDADPITHAVAVQVNYNMNLLFEVWFSFIEPTAVKKFNCPRCLQNILNNFREMKGALVELEREYQLLNSL